MQNHLRVACGAGGEVDQHRIVRGGDVPGQGIGGGLVTSGVSIDPSLDLSTHDDEGFQRRALIQHRTNDGGSIRVGDGDRCFGPVHPIDDVLAFQLGRARHRDRPQLDGAEDRVIPADHPGQHEKHPIALGHPLTGEEAAHLV